MYLEHDAFRIEYDTAKVRLDQIFERIRDLGYEPSRIRRLKDDDPSKKPMEPERVSKFPKPLDDVARAIAEDRLIFVDFHATWCAPCRALERTVLSKPSVREALESYRFVKVDTDTFPDAATHFGVVGLPTLLVVDRRGRELFRHVGPIGVQDLVETLGAIQSAARRNSRKATDSQ